MKQVLQSLNTGKTKLVNAPCPAVKSGQLIIRTSCSLISTGTEKMLIDFGKANPLKKARQQPDKVRMVLDKIRADGILPTLDAVRGKLEQPLPLGYCNVGEVLELGKGVSSFTVGDRVASNGNHAEEIRAPTNLCAKIPANVSNEEAAFTVVGAIALQGVRLANPTLGETVVVIGLGLIGQLTVQLLRANGCRVLGIDFDEVKLDLARSFGAEVVNLSKGEDPIKVAEYFSRGRGVDAVLITAATSSSEPMHQAALMCRTRGRIVLVGVAGLKLSRDDFFKKELTFQVSASYGPGRYDPNYEEKGQDYPVGFVRWTEQRNFEAVLDMLSDRRLVVAPLITHQFSLEEIESAYAIVGGETPSLGVLLRYQTSSDRPNDIIRAQTISLRKSLLQIIGDSNPNIAFIGSGSYATALLIPAFKKAGARLGAIASSSGVSGFHAGEKYDFEKVTTDTSILFNDQKINALVIATRHDSHADLVLQGLYAGKHVFVEKPLCLTEVELCEIEDAYKTLGVGGKIPPILMVGFNRRFAPQVQKIKSLLQGIHGPKSFVMTVNAGKIPTDHWTQDLDIGGGRIIGEACHFIDLLRFLADSPIAHWQAINMNCLTRDTFSVSFHFVDGSIGTVHYFANGCKAFPKERLEVFANGSILQLDNFRDLRGYGWPGFKKMNLWRQDKGQIACARRFVEAISRNTLSPIPIEEIFEVSRTAIEIAKLAN